MPTIIVKEYHFETDWPAQPAAAASVGGTRPRRREPVVREPLSRDVLEVLREYLQVKLDG